MPVHIKLSKLLYDRFGDEIVGELVTWFNAMDASFRNEFRSLSDDVVLRFDLKLEQRFAQFDAIASRRFMEFEARINKRFVDLEAKCENRIVDLESKMDVGFARQDAALERALKEHTRWMLAAWGTLLVAIIGLWARM